ncbi:hypothetical protein JR316_0013557 [Psilocybe cubensis]|uniref:Uncharacterized protein n=2 Tax=Psilocybe cubensis TaxID=181762 RepID=A0ACB8GGE1_PSICU|nr:uncharacterized protein JR316_0013557 [Psilocybe cubensis]KAH9474154.1 hypothetical protein JR316_0013557 [Psilocybe cubensis]
MVFALVASGVLLSIFDALPASSSIIYSIPKSLYRFNHIMVSINSAYAPASPKPTYADVVAGDCSPSAEYKHRPAKGIRNVIIHVKPDNKEDSFSVATDSDDGPLDSVASRIAAAKVVKPGNKTVAKRDIEDAALVCSDEELPARISPPKKSRTSVSANVDATVNHVSYSSDSSVEVIRVVDNSANARYQKGISDAILVDDSSADEMVSVHPTSGAKPNKQKGKKPQKTMPQTVRIKQEPGIVIKQEASARPTSVLPSEVMVKKESVDVHIPLAPDNVASTPTKKDKGKSSVSKKGSVGIRRSARRSEAAIERVPLSVSPLKIGSEISGSAVLSPPITLQGDADSDINPFLPSPEVILGTKIPGKGKSIRIVLPSGPIDLHEDEAMMFAHAVRESRMHQTTYPSSNALPSGPSSSKLLKALDDAYEKYSEADALKTEHSTLDPPVQFKASVISAKSIDAHSDVVMASLSEQPKTRQVQFQSSLTAVPINAAVEAPPTPVTPVRVPRKFKDVVPAGPVNKTPSLGLNGPALMEDTMRFSVKHLPKKCEVTKTDLQDSLLESTYVDLPNLQHGILKQWNSPNVMAPVDCVSFSLCGENFPEMNFENAYDAVTFVRNKNFINPSRVSPLDVSILYMGNDRKRATLQCNSVPAICLSAILTRDSYLLEPISKGLCNKFLSGHMMHQEWERFAGFACMAFGHQVMVASIRDKAITFGTMGTLTQIAERESISPSKPPRTPGILSGQKDAKLQGGSRKALKSSTRFKTMMDSTDTIPIYDSRNHAFNFNTDLDRLDELLPRWRRGEIPPNSFVMVAYTMTQYEKERSFHLCTNIQYAVVFGTEHDTSDIEAEQESFAGFDED